MKSWNHKNNGKYKRRQEFQRYSTHASQPSITPQKNTGGRTTFKNKEDILGEPASMIALHTPVSYCSSLLAESYVNSMHSSALLSRVGSGQRSLSPDWRRTRGVQQQQNENGNKHQSAASIITEHPCAAAECSLEIATAHIDLSVSALLCQAPTIHTDRIG